MASKRQQHLHQYTTNVSDVIRNKQERAKATYVVKCSEHFVLYKGMVLTPASFEKLLPIHVFVISVKGEGCSSHQKIISS